MAPVAADDWVDAPQHEDGWVDVTAHHGTSGSWDAPAQAKPSIPQRILGGLEKVGGMGGPLSVLNPIGQSLGVAKGIASTGFNLYKLAGDLVRDPVSHDTQRAAEETLTPRNAAEAVGKIGEQAGEFMLGEGALTKAATKIPALAKAAVAAPRIARAATAAISGAGVAKAQGASNEQAATAGAIGAGLPALIEGTAAGVKWLGTRTMASGLGIGGKQAAAGAKPETLTKYGLARATLGRTLDAVHGKIVDLATELRGIVRGANAGELPEKALPEGLAATPLNANLQPYASDARAHRAAVEAALGSGQAISPDVAAQYPDLANKIAMSNVAGPKIDLKAAVDSAEQALLSHEGQLNMSPGEVQQVRSALAQYRAMYSDLPRGAVVPIDEAQTVKRAAGLAGAWEHGKPTADRGIERVSNLVYGYLKQAIDQGVGTSAVKLRSVNDALGELMPLEQAIVRRIPIEARQQPIALTDWMLIATGHPIEAGARMTLKTFPVGIGAGAIKAAQGMRTASRPLTATVQQITAAQKNKPDDLAGILRGNH